MGKDRQTGTEVSSEEVWDGMKELVREQAQAFVQGILEGEVPEFMGRRKSERKTEVNGVVGYRKAGGGHRCSAVVLDLGSGR